MWNQRGNNAASHTAATKQLCEPPCGSLVKASLASPAAGHATHQVCSLHKLLREALLPLQDDIGAKGVDGVGLVQEVDGQLADEPVIIALRRWQGSWLSAGVMHVQAAQQSKAMQGCADRCMMAALAPRVLSMHIVSMHLANHASA